MEFNKIQTRMWAQMIKSIERYRKGELNYTDLIYGLEGSLDAGEYQDKELIGQWYDYWTPLEILSADKGDSTTIEEVINYLSEMEVFLKSKYNFRFQEDKE
jgi:hypothetical protein